MSENNSPNMRRQDRLESRKLKVEQNSIFPLAMDDAELLYTEKKI
jgi:hypothetical protein